MHKNGGSSMKLKTNEKEEKKQNFKTSVKCIKLLITSIAMLVLIAMFIMLIIATHSIENTEQKIVDVVENKILGDTKSASVGNNITAIFDSTTGFVTISTTGVDTDTPTLDKDSLFSFYQQCGYDNITEITVQNYIYAPVDSSDLFKGLSQLKSVHNINHLYMNNVTNVSNMFSDCISLDSLNMSEWNMTNVVNTTGMLNRCIFLKLINTPQPSQCPQQDVQLPTMFYNQADETEQREGGTYIIGGAKATFTQETGELKTYDKFNGHTFQQSVNLVVGTIDADSLIALYDEKGHENITTITFEDHVYAPASSSGLFKNLSNLTTVNNAKNFDVSNSERMWEFFSGCSSLTSLDVSGWNTEKVTDMSYLFNGCSSLTELEVEEWDTANCKKMDYMFSGCTGLTTIDISKWTMDNVSIIHSMFSGCTNLTTLNVSQWNIGNVTDIGSVFRDCEIYNQ